MRINILQYGVISPTHLDIFIIQYKNSGLFFFKFFNIWSCCPLVLLLNENSCPLHWRHIVVSRSVQNDSVEICSNLCWRKGKTIITEKQQDIAVNIGAWRSAKRIQMVRRIILKGLIVNNSQTVRQHLQIDVVYRFLWINVSHERPQEKKTPSKI